MVTLHALKPIARGEQVTIHYGGGGDGGATREQRQAAMKRAFGFTCCCEMCSLSSELTAESDRRQSEMAELGRRIRSIAPTAPRAECISLVNRRLELMAIEGMRASWDTYGAAMHFLGRGGDFKGAAQWGARAAMSASIAFGVDSDKVHSFAQTLVGLEAEWVAAGQRLKQDGYVILDGFTGADAASALYAQLTALYREAGATDEFRQGEVGGGPEGIGDDIRNNDAIRGDRRALVDVIDPRVPCLNSAFFLVSQMLMVFAKGAGVDELREVTHRSRPMFTCYEGGARYVRHVDNENDNGRLITCILYLNKNRKGGDGGELVLYPERKSGGAPVTVEPLLDRLVCFWSDARTPHEVLPARQGQRLAVSAWYHNRLPRQVRGDVGKIVQDEESRRRQKRA